MMKNKFEDPQYTKHQLVNTIKSVYEDLKVYFSRTRVLKNNFPNLIDDIIKIDSLLIALGIITTY